MENYRRAKDNVESYQKQNELITRVTIPAITGIATSGILGGLGYAVDTYFDMPFEPSLEGLIIAGGAAIGGCVSAFAADYKLYNRARDIQEDIDTVRIVESSMKRAAWGDRSR